MNTHTSNADELLSIGETSRRTGTAVSALRYYEDLGLIASVRTGGNHRLYARHMLRRISLISVAKNLSTHRVC
ncbi:MerR family DNA-binding transcriptional regulator, partial [Corynebacterium sp. AOP12-C2-36]|uniref:MerR family DNA-binding transcriptional regulator n=1 Tax=Corynebacterium sp. AOP12-C2-36 TaxID=3457723 RepID=UPI00403327F0